MHPALSVIVFTTLSGAGYGLLAWLGLYAAAGALPPAPLFAIAAMLLALGAVTAGLLSSTLHLGHPERAWRALSQWRSSWLSREGVAALVTYLPVLAFGAAWIAGGGAAWIGVGGALTALCAALTVACTAYIYRSLKPIPRWCNGWVVPNYLALSAMTGALLLAMLADGFGLRLPLLHGAAAAAIVVALLCKLGYWRFIDRDRPASTPESATGLGHLGTVTLFEAPPTSDNYLMTEMGFRIARKHARKLRVIAVTLGFVLPLVLTATAGLVAADFAGGLVAAAASLVAAVSALIGTLTGRWLVVAQSQHTFTLY